MGPIFNPFFWVYSVIAIAIALIVALAIGFIALAVGTSLAKKFQKETAWIRTLALTMASGGFIFIFCGLCQWTLDGLALAYQQDLPADYAVWAVDINEQAVIVEISGSEGITVISPMIFAYGWNDDFIIAKQHPVLGANYEVATEVTNWYIIEVKSKTHFGPLVEEEFINLRDKLNIPDDLTFTETIEP